MRYRTLGWTGIQVSPYALGALMFATSMGNAPEDSARIIHTLWKGVATTSCSPPSSAARPGRTPTSKVPHGAGSSAL